MSGKGAKAAKAPKGGKKAPKKKGANGYKLPDPIPAGEVLTDIAKKQWIIGPSIGVGGFGEIYSAASYAGGTPKSYPYVIKIEPHGNGPLFVEMHFYMRNAKATDVASWKKEKNLSFLGMPNFIGSGSHDCHNQKYRFVVMERFGKNLWDLFKDSNRKFPEHTVYKIALQIINVLEYMHHKTYVHADIKGANLLQSLKSQDHIYLVDFGLASHYTNKTEYKPDPKKTHNGTIEYTSRDMHMGIPTMRGDIEILLYNMIQWLCGSLPWENNLSDPAAVQRQKDKAFDDIPQFLNRCFTQDVPEPVNKLMKLLDTVKFTEAPDYVKLKEILVKGLQALGHKPEGKLEFVDSGKAQKILGTPSKGKKPGEASRKSPRTQRARTPSPSPSPSASASRSPNGLNDSDLGSLIINRRGKRGEEKRRILKNIEITDDSDMEIEIKIKKKRKNKKDENTKLDTKEVAKSLMKQTTKKLAKLEYDPDETFSDDQTTQVLMQGTRSRPRATLKRKKTTAGLDESEDENADSSKDMFADNDDDEAQDTPPKKPARSWRDMPTVKSSNGSKPGEYKSVKETKSTRVQRR